MSTAKSSPPSRSPTPINVGCILFDRATLEGLECLDSGWDEWDACVAAQDLRDAVSDALRVGQRH